MQELMKGQKYTITANSACGDRSYTCGVHIVTAFNGTHVQTTYHDDNFAPRTVILNRREHVFSPADDFALPTGTFNLKGLGDLPLLDPDTTTDALN
ncbi:hypothetical protein [Deinococcus marmoris]|uniref:Uncharacterized protein n=1 Tax=Deinococcus marmoris TaxID=249408 RepID=A0A1U7P4U2_9DEIO|nr:hypothetical protein [Deinococcus marmoris]OLV20176.1 hypothetical protein BOO71_0000556 [Deinococcus marmoris]